MKNSLSNNQAEIILNKLLTYSHQSYQWLVNTPTRALNRAYLAALNLKSLEADYAAQKRSDEIVLNYLQSDIDKNLAIIKLNLAEFKVSRFVLNNCDRDYWSKIILVEEVLSKYRTDLIEPVVISDTNTIKKTSEKNYNSPSWQDNLNSVKPITEKTGALPRSLGRTLSKIQTELKENSEAKIIYNFRRDRRITRTAIRCLLLLIIIPFRNERNCFSRIRRI